MMIFFPAGGPLLSIGTNSCLKGTVVETLTIFVNTSLKLSASFHPGAVVFPDVKGRNARCSRSLLTRKVKKYRIQLRSKLGASPLLSLATICPYLSDPHRFKVIYCDCSVGWIILEACQLRLTTDVALHETCSASRHCPRIAMWWPCDSPAGALILPPPTGRTGRHTDWSIDIHMSERISESCSAPSA